MNPEKKVIVDHLLQKIDGSPFVLLVDYTGMTVPQFNELRSRLRAANTRLHVTKNSYIRAAGAAKGFPEDLNRDLTGQTAIAFGDADICRAAKIIKSFHAEFTRPVLKSAVLDGKLLSNEEVAALADIGSREDLLARLLSVINGPAAALARVIQARVDSQSPSEAPAAE